MVIQMIKYGAKKKEITLFLYLCLSTLARI